MWPRASVPTTTTCRRQLVFDGANTATLLEHRWRLVEQAPRELTSFPYGSFRGRLQPLVRGVTVYADDDPEDAVAGAIGSCRRPTTVANARAPARATGNAEPARLADPVFPSLAIIRIA